MMHGMAALALRPFGFVALVCCAAALTSVAAQAEDTPAHVDAARPNIQPYYPDTAQAAGEQGTVLVNVFVRSNGHPSNFKIEQSSGFGDLDNSAVESVLNWHFVPATRGGDTVADWTTVKIVYQLPSANQASAPPAQH